MNASIDAMDPAARGGTRRTERARRMRPWLGTCVDVAACAHTRRSAERAIDAAFAAVKLAHARWSFHDPDSELSRVNRSPGHAVPVSATTARLLRLARSLMHASDGAFDFTVGGQLVDEGWLPDHGGARLPRGSTADLEIGRDWARLVRPVRLTLDGIAKGFAVDLAVAALRRAGALGGCVNAGGDLRAFGDLTVPVLRRDESGRLVALGGLRDAAIATSGARDAMPGASPFPGRIVGEPSRPACAGTWTVLAGTAWRADALTKVAACTPADRRDATVHRLAGRLVGAAR